MKSESAGSARAPAAVVAPLPRSPPEPAQPQPEPTEPAVLDLIAYIALVIITTGLPLGMWSQPRRRRGRHRADRQLLRLIRTETRRTAR